jgi:hypothetical protein
MITDTIFHGGAIDMGNITKILEFLAKVVNDQMVTPERTAELAGVITQYRSAPGTADTQPEWEASKAVTNVTESNDVRGRGEFLLHDCLPELWTRLDDTNVPADKLAADLIAICQKKQGAHVLWLDLPDGACFCHCSWIWNDNKRQASVRIRDYLRKKLYFAVTAHTDSEGGKWKLERWDKGGAYHVWYAAKRRIRCRGLLAVGVEEIDKWTATLDEMTRYLAPGLK